MKKVVLIGASGFVGSAILNEALNRGFHVTAVVRHPEKIKIENENLEVKRADVSSLDEDRKSTRLNSSHSSQSRMPSSA